MLTSGFLRCPIAASLDTSAADGFLFGYLRYQCSIPQGEDCRRLKMKNKGNA
jgi:hypothetical protein